MTGRRDRVPMHRPRAHLERGAARRVALWLLAFCAWTALRLPAGAGAFAWAQGPADRLDEVVAVTRQMFLYDIPSNAYAEALRAARIAAGEKPDARGAGTTPTSPAQSLAGAVRDLTARTPARADAIVTAAIRAFTEGLGDPYTTWLSASDKATLEAQLSGGAFTGIGVEVAPDPRGLRIVASLAGAPARAAGLRSRDRIVAVDGASLAGLGLYRAADRLLGPPDSALTLTVERDGSPPRAVRVLRARLSMPPVRAGVLDENGVPVGYVRIAIFGPQTGDETREALGRLARDGARGWIIDLRDCPGGTLKSALDIAGLFAPGQVLLRVTGKGGREDERRAPGAPATTNPRAAPVVVLINSGTASSAEVLAGAWSDLGLAKTMGERSFGKGVIQTMVPLQGGGALRLTTARYRTPAGRDIHGVGIAPDMQTPTAGDALVGRALRWVSQRVR